MTYLYATIHTLGVHVRESVERHRTRPDEGSTLEQVFWAVALLAIAGVVYAAYQRYVNNNLPGIN